MSGQVTLWIVFNAFVLAMLVLDLALHRRAHVIRIREALAWSAFWVLLSLIFCAGIYFFRGSATALQFLTGYLIEKSLSVDNIFVFIMIFSYFSVPAAYEHKVLFWGVLGALIMRAIFIAAGVALIHRFHWVIYVFGVFLVVTGVRLVFKRHEKVHPERNPILRLFRRLMPVTDGYEDGRFFVKKAGSHAATLLFVVLLVVESTDLIFAADSIPAILAITPDPFIVYSSNVLAILGLRSLYFALAGLVRIFHYLHYGLSAILVFVGVKMLASPVYEIPIGVALGVVAGVLTIAVASSIIWPSAKSEAAQLTAAGRHVDATRSAP